MIEAVIEGRTYRFNPLKDQILKRGIIDTYSLSPKSNEWIVLDSYVFWSARLMAPIIIPRWFVTDLASVPKGLRWLISVNERHRLASLPHDFGYWLNRVSDRIDGQPRVTKGVWDSVLKDFCKQQRVSRWKTWAIHTAVRLGGNTAYTAPQELLFAPLEHRQWYQNVYPLYNLDRSVGEFAVL